MNRKQRRALTSQDTGRRQDVFKTAASRGVSGSRIRIDEMFALAIEHQKSARLMEAEALHRQIIAADPSHFGSLYLLGVAALQRGQIDVAIDLIGRALSIRPNYAEAQNNLGNAFKARGDVAEAIVRYRRALSLNPGYAEAHNGLGIALKAQGKFAEAALSYEKALALKPDYAEAFNNLGNALIEQREVGNAVTHYRRALALNPNYAEAHNNLGAALMELSQIDDAVAQYERALSLKPNFAEAHNNLGNALKTRGDLTEAIVRYRRALALKPDYVDGCNNFGAVLQELGKFDEAAAQFARALVIKPDHAGTLTNLGNLLLQQDKPEEAVVAHRRALAAKPDFPEAYNNLGAALVELGESDDAAACHKRALELKPDLSAAKFALCMAQLPVLYVEEPEINRRRARYRDCLEALRDEIDARKTPRDLATAVGSSQPFYLAYQGRNDRALQTLYGSIVCRLVAECYGQAPLAPPPQPGEPVRVGIVSGYFRHHSNWKIPIKGWLSQFDRKLFQIFGYHTGVQTDAETRLAASLCHRFVQGPLTVNAWRQTIIGDAPHVLIYPEVGMDPASAQLAAQRLASVQCNSWGHPDTSGFPTLDYYLSSDLMEPPDGQDHYSERLVRLPNLSIYYDEPDPQAVEGSGHLASRPETAVYWCGQSLFKYLPQYDQVFPRIAREVGDCQFVFVQHHRGERIGVLFRKRLERSFAEFGLKYDDYCLLLPRLDPQKFVATIGQCDIILDSIGWSGCNSTLESLCHDLPIVTMSAPLMRGRHSAAILKMMAITETITETIDDYVSTAVRLARDESWRIAIKRKIAKNKFRIYRDRNCISAMEEFLIRVARQRPVGKSASIDSVQMA